MPLKLRALFESSATGYEVGDSYTAKRVRVPRSIAWSAGSSPGWLSLNSRSFRVRLGGRMSAQPIGHGTDVVAADERVQVEHLRSDVIRPGECSAVAPTPGMPSERRQESEHEQHH